MERFRAQRKDFLKKANTEALQGFPQNHETSFFPHLVYSLDQKDRVHILTGGNFLRMRNLGLEEFASRGVDDTHSLTYLLPFSGERLPFYLAYRDERYACPEPGLLAQDTLSLTMRKLVLKGFEGENVSLRLKLRTNTAEGLITLTPESTIVHQPATRYRSVGERTTLQQTDKLVALMQTLPDSEPCVRQELS